MKKMKIILSTAAILLAILTGVYAQPQKPLRVVAIFAHPDDAESKMGGTAALWAKMGAEVKFVSLTNGDAGHFAHGGGVLANIRRTEAEEARKRLGIAEYVVLNNHDGELLPDLQVRTQVIREIRKWDADVVLGLRPNDYHPDHRNAGKVVMDASYMVAVPNVVSDIPPLKKNPVFLYMQDHFQKPNPFSRDIVVAVDDAIEQKIEGLDAHTTQMYEWLPWIQFGHDLSMVPPASDPDARKKWLREWRQLDRPLLADEIAGLEKWYGKEKASTVKHVESFEITEYGSQPTDEEIRRLFPMLSAN